MSKKNQLIPKYLCDYSRMTETETSTSSPEKASVIIGNITMDEPLASGLRRFDAFVFTGFGAEFFKIHFVNNVNIKINRQYVPLTFKF